MGFFSWLMKGVDIQDNTQQNAVKEEKQLNIENQKVENEAVLEDLHMLSKKEKEATFKYDYIQPASNGQIDNRLGLNSEKYASQSYQQPRPKAELLVFKINEMKDIQLAITHLAKKQPCVIDIGKIAKKEKARLLEYLAGAVFALKGTMHKFKKESYVLSPEGMSISLQKK